MSGRSKRGGWKQGEGGVGRGGALPAAWDALFICTHAPPTLSPPPPRGTRTPTLPALSLTHQQQKNSDDPTIFAWDICNEPRCEGDATHGVLRAWIDETAAYVKSLDPSHPVTVGLEGFFGPSTPDLAARCNPYRQTHGVDWAAECASPHIDFASIHLYADQVGDTGR